MGIKVKDSYQEKDYVIDIEFLDSELRRNKDESEEDNDILTLFIQRSLHLKMEVPKDLYTQRTRYKTEVNLLKPIEFLSDTERFLYKKFGNVSM